MYYPKEKIQKAGAAKGFSLLVGLNRPISPGHVTKIADSLTAKGCLRQVIVATMSFISGNKETYVIDGQHLYHALMRLNVDVPYIEVTIKDMTDLVETIAKLNASSKSWSMVDYITSWSWVNTDYTKLMHYYNVYDFELSTIACLLHNQSISIGHHITTVIKKGTFKVSDETTAIQYMDYMTDVLKIIPRMDRKSNNTFLVVYIDRLRSWGAGYNHKKFLTWVSSNKTSFATITGSTEEIGNLLDKAV